MNILMPIPLETHQNVEDKIFQDEVRNQITLSSILPSIKVGIATDVGEVDISF